MRHAPATLRGFGRGGQGDRGIGELGKRKGRTEGEGGGLEGVCYMRAESATTVLRQLFNKGGGPGWQGS
jgi:hypothetical protein